MIHRQMFFSQEDKIVLGKFFVEDTNPIFALVFYRTTF